MKPNQEIYKSRYNIEALSRGLDILSLFSAQRPVLNLTQIVEILGINKSTAFRVLSTLEVMQYLEHDPVTRLYKPGLKVLQLGFTAIGNLEIRQVAHPFLDKLSKEVGETISLAILNGFQTIYIDRIQNQMIVGVVLGIGSSLPAHCTSLGKVLISDLPEAELERFLKTEELRAFTPHTLITENAIRLELNNVRKNGYAIDDEELASGLRAASVPIRDLTGRSIAAINVTGTIDRITHLRMMDEIIPELLNTASSISTTLGYFK